MIQPDLIVEQRLKGWTDFHPEDYCHKCGGPNIRSWWVDSVEWNLAIRRYEDGKHVGPISGYPASEIVCPQCFIDAWEKATGVSVSWELKVDPGTDPR